MNNSQVEQLFSYFNELGKEKKVLLVSRNDIDYDTIAGMIAFKYALEGAYKDTVELVFNKEVSAKYKRLLNRYNVQYTTKLAKTKYIIKINYADKTGAEIDRIKWDDDGEDLFLYITPLKGKFDFNRVSFDKAGSDYDSVVVFGCRNLTWLEPLYSQVEYLFQNSSVVNFNNLSGNQVFGDLKVGEEGTPISTVVYYFAKRLNILNQKADETTQKLVGSLTEGTLSSVQIMQVGTVPDTSLTVLSELSDKSGNVKTAFNDIYSYYQKGTVEMQRRIFKNMKDDQTAGVYWSTVSGSDIKEIMGDVKDVDLGGKIIFNVSGNHKVAFVLYEYDTEIKGVLEVNDPSLNAKELVGNYTMGGDRYRTVFVAKDRKLSIVEQELLSNVKSVLGVEISSVDKYNKQEPETKAADKATSSEKESKAENPKGESKGSGDSRDGLVTPPPVKSEEESSR